MREYDFSPSEELSRLYMRRVERNQPLKDSDLTVKYVKEHISKNVLDAIICQAVSEKELILTRDGFVNDFLEDLKEGLNGMDRYFISQLYKEFRNYIRDGAVKIGEGRLELDRWGKIFFSGHKVEIPDPDLDSSGWVVTE
jgi:hypothetical protein